MTRTRAWRIRLSQAPAAGVDTPFGRFFLPGPTEVHPEVLEAQTRAMMGHRGPAIQEFVSELQDGLKKVFCTDRPVFAEPR
jgi:aspartate aminotransferase-like enzyme